MSSETSGRHPVEDNAAEPQRQFNFLSYWLILRHYPLSEYEFFFLKEIVVNDTPSE